MNRHNALLYITVLVLGLAIGNAGCVESVSVTAAPQFCDLFDSLRQLDQGIQDALSADPPGDAHDLVHDAGRILSAMAEVDSQSGLTATQCAEVHNVAQDLLAAFGALDAVIELGDAPDYESMRDRIKAGMTKLQALAAD